MDGLEQKAREFCEKDEWNGQTLEDALVAFARSVLNDEWVAVKDRQPDSPHPMAYAPYLVTCSVEGSSLAWVQRGVWIHEPEGCRWGQDGDRELAPVRVLAYRPLPAPYKETK